MHDDFELEYSVFLKTNNQNLKQINNRDRAETETPQEQVIMQQQNMMEEKHFEDQYKLKKGGTEVKVQPKKKRTNPTLERFEKVSSIEKIMRQVN